MDTTNWVLAAIGFSVVTFLAGYTLGMVVERKHLMGDLFPLPDKNMPGPVERAYRRKAAREKRIADKDLRPQVLTEDSYGLLEADELEERN